MRYRADRGGAVYRIFDAEGSLLYIGSTGCVRTRIAHHRSQAARLPELAGRYARHTVEFYPTLEDARDAEAKAIAAESPELNQRTPSAGRDSLDPLEAAILHAADAAGVSICELAYRLDMDRRILDRALARGDLSALLLYRIAQELGCTASSLMALAEERAA